VAGNQSAEAIRFIRDPIRRPVSADLAAKLERAGLFETAELARTRAEKRASGEPADEGDGQPQ
jgi:hypothetical protein